MRAQEATSSRCSYNVFLSFRGEDTRHTFTDHLYTALVHAGIRTFRDADELDRGSDIASAVEKVIKDSRISIIIFSKRYASSRWCLDELLKILQQKKSVGHIVVPVFYHVDPTHVRKQMGCFAEAFSVHEEQFEAETDQRKQEGMAKVKRWKAALKEVAGLAGMVVEDGHESKFIEQIVKEIGNKLNRRVLSVGPYQIGIDSRVKDMNMWLQDGSTDVGIMIICGMGGIGKTTIAKTVYNLNFDRFDGSSFLANIKEVSEQPNGLVCLQRQLLSDVLRGRKEKVNNVDEGIIKIRDAICSKRVLVVLDDVDQLDQLNAVLVMQDWFYPGSKIIITTRHEQLLKAHEFSKMHKVKELNEDESFQLFSWHAFGKEHPIEAYMELSKMVVNYCGGLPLALQVLGSSLFGRSLDVWESALQKLEEIPDSQIVKKLKISFDSLQDDHDRNLFLEIACFFVGKDVEFIITILDGCNFYTKVGINNLIDRCLLSINENKKLTMHQLLRDMGREIVRQESSKEPGKRSRLWHHKDALSVLREKTGTETVEGLILNLHMPKVDRPGEKFIGTDNSKRHRSEDYLDKSSLLYRSSSPKRRRLGLFSWFPINSVLTESFSTSNEVELQTDTFSKMQKLRLLKLNNSRLNGDYKKFPRTLRWLCWCGFPLKSIPNEFPLESLVVLDMRYSSLKQVWKGNKLLRSLRILNLGHSHDLTNTPNFSQLPNLEKLILKDCINLIEVHESIGESGRLSLLNLKGCKNLRKLPTKIGQLKSLEVLFLSGCTRLDRLATTELGEMESLKMIHASGTAINQSPSTASKSRSWHSQLWCWVSKPRKIPRSISFSSTPLSFSLRSLSLAHCNLLDNAIPRELGSLSLLQNLDLSRNPICSLPVSIKGLTVLKSLSIMDCTRLQSLPELPLSLEKLNLFNCRSLEMVANLPNLFTLQIVTTGCDKLVEVQGLFKLEYIGNIDAEMRNNLGLSNLDFMGKFEVYLFNNFSFTKRKVPLQGLYEFGIFSIFLHGNKVPDWFSYKSVGSSLCFDMKSLPNLKIRGLNICVVYAHADECFGDLDSWKECYIKTINKTKDLEWLYGPTFVGIPDDNKEMIWLSHWKMGNQLEVGDKVNVSVILFDNLKLKEFGVHVVYEKEEKGTQKNTYPYCQNVNDGYLSAYHWSIDVHFLCHFIHQIRIRTMLAMIMMHPVHCKRWNPLWNSPSMIEERQSPKLQLLQAVKQLQMSRHLNCPDYIRKTFCFLMSFQEITGVGSSCREWLSSLSPSYPNLFGSHSLSLFLFIMNLFDHSDQCQ